MLNPAALLSLAAGFLVWVSLSLAAGGGEAWDRPAYWRIGLPLLAIAAGVAGYLVPVRVWRWSLLIALGQLVGLLVTNPGGGLGLLPLALLFVFLPLVLGLTIPALIGGVVARRGWDPALV